MTLSQRTLALIAGASLLAMAIIAGFGYGYAFQNLYVANDVASTVKNFTDSPILARGFIASFVVILILDVLVAWALYLFFEPVHKAWSLLAAGIRIVYAPLLGISLLPVVFALNLLRQSDFLHRFQYDNLVLESIRTFMDVWSLGLIVFGCHLFVLGYLMLRSARIPKILGALMLLAALCYIVANTAHLLVPKYELYQARVDAVLSLPMAIGELGLAVWLLAKGGKDNS
jgi:hypothetical protein